MKILHTSDWHLGRTLYGRKRYEEFEAFLNWLAETIRQNQIDALLVAGDVFDTSAPSHRAQELYYRFLCRVAASCCRHVVVVAGNHDSSSFLNAPKELLRALDVHVVGSACETLDDEVLILTDKHGSPELIICAVPYLRDRDIRVAEAGESIEDKERKLIEGIRNHYAEVVAIAEKRRYELHKLSNTDSQNSKIPLIAMGHLFTAGGETIDGDGVRELYVGSLAHVSAGIFPDTLDYVALGHLHVPQKVNGSEVIRYSGSPLPMGFGEAKQRKSVVIVDFFPQITQRDADCVDDDNNLCESAKSADVHGIDQKIYLISVPVFQTLERIKGNWDEISSRLLELSATGFQAWIEVIYEGDEVVGDLRERLDTAIAGSKMAILRVKNNRIINRVLGQIETQETLDDLNANDVFERCLAANEVPENQRPELIRTYSEVIHLICEENRNKE